MKRFFLMAAVAVLGFTANAQDFKLGATVGIPIGDAGDFYTLNFGVDAAAFWEVSEDFEAGVSTGYNHSILDSDFEGDGFQYVPIAASGRFNASEEFQIGADLGYALGLNEGNDGGFYYRPVVGYNVSEKVQITLSYRGISVDGGNFSTINAGVNFSL